MGKCLQRSSLRKNLFSVHVLAWTVASSVLKESSATPPTALEGRGLQRGVDEKSLSSLVYRHVVD